MEFVHALSRGVDKRKIFLDEQDYVRFIHDLYEFNDQEPASNNYYFFQKTKSNVIARRYIPVEERKQRKLLVTLHLFCLMPNHYHLLLSPRVENGISRFMKKLNMGYARYFNERYERQGTLFEGRYKSVSVAKEPHFIHLPYYIHCNPLDLVASEWRSRRINDYKKAIKFLSEYRWSSHLDYVGEKNFPSVTQRNFLMEFFGSPMRYRSDFEKWLKDMDFDTIRGMTLE